MTRATRGKAAVLVRMRHVPARAGLQPAPRLRVDGERTDTFALLLRKRVQVPGGLLVEPAIEQAAKQGLGVVEPHPIAGRICVRELREQIWPELPDAALNRLPLLGFECGEILQRQVAVACDHFERAPDALRSRIAYRTRRHVGLPFAISAAHGTRGGGRSTKRRRPPEGGQRRRCSTTGPEAG